MKPSMEQVFDKMQEIYLHMHIAEAIVKKLDELSSQTPERRKLLASQLKQAKVWAEFTKRIIKISQKVSADYDSVEQDDKDNFWGTSEESKEMKKFIHIPDDPLFVQLDPP